MPSTRPKSTIEADIVFEPGVEVVGVTGLSTSSDSFLQEEIILIDTIMNIKADVNLFVYLKSKFLFMYHFDEDLSVLNSVNSVAASGHNNCDRKPPFIIM